MTDRRILIEPEVHAGRKELPGHVRQRMKRAIAGLASEPRPPESREIDVSGLEVPQGVGFFRLRIDRWRLVYAVNDEAGWVWVLAIRKRPPYDYDDLGELTTKVR